MSGTPPNDHPTERAALPFDDAISALRRHASQRRFALVVFHEGGTETATLEVGVPVVVGRKPPATITVASGKLSRLHARFTLDASGHAKVEDLGSTNGTWLRGKRIEAAEISPGEEILVGDVLACVQASPRAEVEPAAAGDAVADAPIAVAPSMREVIDTCARVAASMVPVILQGETGTGKEVLAAFLHAGGPRAKAPLVSVNCAAIPESLVESTLFGHERGAFTGAAQRQKGVFEEADGGTVFLDEIGELPLSAQAALLRVLETRRFARVGSPREIAVDVRVIAATHRDLEALRDSGAFRADLYYRLGVMVIAIPPLRERREDIEPLARRFLARTGERVRDIDAEALAVLRAYAWPGNVRELRNAIERAAVLSRREVIGAEDLPARLRETTAAPRARTTTLTDAPAPSAGELRARLQEYESRVLREALEATGWNQSEAARRLDMPIRTLSHKVKMLGLKKPGA